MNAKLPPNPLLQGERLAALQADLDAIGKEARAATGPEDLAHYGRMARIGRLCTILGWATSWVAPNPISILLLSLGRFMRWTMVAHHTSHGGYRPFKEGRPALDPKQFGEGRRRLVDWLDWVEPAAWKHEHDRLHHYKLNELGDPDLVEENLSWLRDSRIPMPLRYVLVFIGASTWRWVYYAPNTFRHLEARRQRIEVGNRFPFEQWLPHKANFWRFVGRCMLPYGLWNFALLPLLFAPLGWWAAASAWINSALAEWLTNLHSFTVIVPNHAGEDLWRFDKSTKGRGDFYQRQILGSANYRIGGDLNDLMHGWLNYQIEHHLWPDLSMLQYRRIAPQARAVCEAHGLPYVQESVWTRLRKCVAVMVGAADMKQAVVPD